MSCHPTSAIEAWATTANVLTVSGVEVRRAAEPFSADGRSYPAGSLVVPMGPAIPRAREGSSTAAVHAGERSAALRCRGVDAAFHDGRPRRPLHRPFTANLVNVDSVVPTPGRIEGSGDVFVLRNHTNAESSAIARLLASGQSVSVVGDSLIVRGPKARSILTEEAARHGFRVTAIRTAPAGTCPPAAATHRRVSTWTGNIDEGWTLGVRAVWHQLRQYATAI
jgi:hypothetical protein